MSVVVRLIDWWHERRTGHLLTMDARWGCATCRALRAHGWKP